MYVHNKQASSLIPPNPYQAILVPSYLQLPYQEIKNSWVPPSRSPFFADEEEDIPESPRHLPRLKFTREVMEKAKDTSIDYYNEWVMSNVG